MVWIDARSADRWASSWVGAAADVVELLFPQPCAVCGGGNRALCPVCRAFVYRLTARPRDVTTALPQWSPQTPCIAAGLYGHEVARAILAFKGQQRLDLVPFLARALARAISEALRSLQPEFSGRYGGRGTDRETPVLLVPAPSRALAYRRRGFVPGEILARRALKEMDKTTRWESVPDVRVAPVLKIREPLVARLGTLRDPSSSGQKGLNAHRRSERLRDSMHILGPSWLPSRWFWPEMSGRDCLLIDDVATTGSTLREMRRAIQAAGGRVLGAAVVASVSAPTEKPPKNLEELGEGRMTKGSV